MSQLMRESLLKNQAIVSMFDSLVRGTSPDRESIALQCFAKSLIPATMTTNPEMSTILHTIRDRITTERTGTAFETLLGILRSDFSTIYLADMLTEKLRTLNEEFSDRNYYLPKKSELCQSGEAQLDENKNRPMRAEPLQPLEDDNNRHHHHSVGKTHQPLEKDHYPAGKEYYSTHCPFSSEEREPDSTHSKLMINTSDTSMISTTRGKDSTLEENIRTMSDFQAHFKTTKLSPPIRKNSDSFAVFFDSGSEESFHSLDSEEDDEDEDEESSTTVNLGKISSIQQKEFTEELEKPSFPCPPQSTGAKITTHPSSSHMGARITTPTSSASHTSARITIPTSSASHTSARITTPTSSASNTSSRITTPTSSLISYVRSIQEVNGRLKDLDLNRDSLQEEEHHECKKEVGKLTKQLQRLREERAKENGYTISVCMKRDRLKMQLRAMKREELKKKREIKELRAKIEEMMSQDLNQKAQIKDLKHQNEAMMYMELYCNDFRAEKLKIQEELLSVKTEIRKLREKENRHKEIVTDIRTKLHFQMDEAYKYKIEADTLKKKVIVLEDLVERFRVVTTTPVDNCGVNSTTTTTTTATASEGIHKGTLKKSNSV